MHRSRGRGQVQVFPTKDLRLVRGGHSPPGSTAMPRLQPRAFLPYLCFCYYSHLESLPVSLCLSKFYPFRVSTQVLSLWKPFFGQPGPACPLLILDFGIPALLFHLFYIIFVLTYIKPLSSEVFWEENR